MHIWTWFEYRQITLSSRNCAMLTRLLVHLHTSTRESSIRSGWIAFTRNRCGEHIFAARTAAVRRTGWIMMVPNTTGKRFFSHISSWHPHFLYWRFMHIRGPSWKKRKQSKAISATDLYAGSDQPRTRIRRSKTDYNQTKGRMIPATHTYTKSKSHALTNTNKHE